VRIFELSFLNGADAADPVDGNQNCLRNCRQSSKWTLAPFALGGGPGVVKTLVATSLPDLGPTNYGRISTRSCILCNKKITGCNRL
jgi:hypothetical protein